MTYFSSQVKVLGLKNGFVSKIFYLLIFVLLTGFLALHIFQVNRAIFGDYVLAQQKQRLSRALAENKNLEVDSSQAVSLEKVEGLAMDSGFEKTDKVHYIQVLEGQVVSR